MLDLLIDANKHLQKKNLPYNLQVVCNGIIYLLLYKSTFAGSADWEEVGTILVAETTDGETQLDPMSASTADIVIEAAEQLKTITDWIDRTLANPQINLKQA